MSERDQVVVLLKTLERPVEPRREFTDALRERLLAELGDGNGHRAWVPRPPRLPVRPRRSRRVLVVALAVVLAAGAIAAVLLSRPAPASALDLIRQAQRQAASVPPFEATVRFDLNPDGSTSTRIVPKGATETWELSYGGPTRLRNAFASQHLQAVGARPVGSYDVLDGHRTASYDPKRKTFSTSTVPDRFFTPLGDLTWQGGYPDWEKVCRGPAAQVLPDTRAAGRDARHIRCTDAIGDVWQLWIDSKTGLVLRLEGQTGGNDTFFDSVPTTSQKGGFTITRLRYNPTFPPGTFKIAKPHGASDYQARLSAAAAMVPPFRALISTRYGHGGTRTERVWWLNNTTWRAQDLAGPALFGGAGSFIVSAHGSIASYDANDNSYSRTTFSPAASPIAKLLPVGNKPTHARTACPIVGHNRIAARPAVHHRCSGFDIWIDTSTGLTLQIKSPHYQLRVVGLRYHPTFPAGTFHFVRPSGSRSAEHRANDPYFKTRLRPGRLAPNWRAPLLNGGTFQITDLRGKPALLLLYTDDCGAGCIITNVYAPLERLYRQAKSKLAVVWVDIDGQSLAQARKVVRHNHITFPVVDDNQGPGINHSNSLRAWKYRAYPYWVLLDSHGRVIEARLKPQTLSQLRQLVHPAE